MRYLIFIAVFPLFISCKKSNPTPQNVRSDIGVTRGLPEDPKKVNAFLYAGYYKQGNNCPLYYYAAFSEDPVNLFATYHHYNNNRNLLFPEGGKVNTGKLYAGEKLMDVVSITTTDFYYSRTFMNPQKYSSVTWRSSGNGSWDSFTDSLADGYPEIHPDTAQFKTISKNGQTLNLSQNFSNYDSVVVIIKENSPAAPVIKRGWRAEAITLTARDFHDFYEGTDPFGSIRIYLFRYSYKVVKGRIYVYELANSFVLNDIVLSED